MAPPKDPENVTCPDCGEDAKLVPHSPFRYPGIDPFQHRIVRCPDHGKQKIAVNYVEEDNQLMQTGEA